MDTVTPELLFRAAEHAVGKPRQTHEVESDRLADILSMAHATLQEKRR